MFEERQPGREYHSLTTSHFEPYEGQSSRIPKVRLDFRTINPLVRLIKRVHATPHTIYRQNGEQFAIRSIERKSPGSDLRIRKTIAGAEGEPVEIVFRDNKVTLLFQLLHESVLDTLREQVYNATYLELASAGALQNPQDVLTEKDDKEVLEWLDTAQHDGDPSTDNSLIGARLKSSAWELLINWLSELNLDKLTVREHIIEIPEEEILLHRISIEPREIRNSKAEWYIDQKVLEVLLFAKKELGINIPTTITLFNIATFEEIVHYPDEVLYKSGLQSILESVGLAYPKHAAAVVFQEAKFCRHNRKRYLAATGRHSCHEVAHLVDVAAAANTAAREAFAMQFETDFNFITAELLRRRDYPGEVTIDKTIELFRQISSHRNQSMPPIETKNEVYGIAQSLYSYISDRLGPGIVAQFHAMLGQNDIRGDIIAALTVIFKRNGDKKPYRSAKKLIQEFVSETNRESL